MFKFCFLQQQRRAPCGYCRNNSQRPLSTHASRSWNILIYVYAHMYIYIYIYIRVLNSRLRILAWSTMLRIAIPGLRFSTFLSELSKMSMLPAGGRLPLTIPRMNRRLKERQILVRTRPVCKYRLRNSRNGPWQQPSSRSHAHFAKRKQEFRKSHAGDWFPWHGAPHQDPLGFETRLVHV